MQRYTTLFHVMGYEVASSQSLFCEARGGSHARAYALPVLDLPPATWSAPQQQAGCGSDINKQETILFLVGS